MKKQSKADKMHEAKAMKMVMEKKSKAKKAESLGMKKAMKRK